MTKERGLVLPLEQRCVRPGHWVVEGYDVRRCKDGFETYWTIEQFGNHVMIAVSLRDAREWIAGQRQS